MREFTGDQPQKSAAYQGWSRFVIVTVDSAMSHRQWVGGVCHTSSDTRYRLATRHDDLVVSWTRVLPANSTPVYDLVRLTHGRGLTAAVTTLAFSDIVQTGSGTKQSLSTRCQSLVFLSPVDWTAGTFTQNNDQLLTASSTPDNDAIGAGGLAVKTADVLFISVHILKQFN